jgi:hypothetical protein
LSGILVEYDELAGLFEGSVLSNSARRLPRPARAHRVAATATVAIHLVLIFAGDLIFSTTTTTRSRIIAGKIFRTFVGFVGIRPHLVQVSLLAPEPLADY